LQLIALGADIHFINTARNAAGSALHEAAAHRHEALIELLLSAGANPFAANAAGRTALDEAVLASECSLCLDMPLSRALWRLYV
jgi:ankyrin repeat protein